MESIRIPEGHGDAFVALLRTMPDADAVALVKNAVNVGLDKNHNQRELLLAKSFKPWITEMDAKGVLNDRTDTKAEEESEMPKEMLAALRRIESVAYWHAKDVTDPVELKDALQYIADEVSLLVALVKEHNDA